MTYQEVRTPGLPPGPSAHTPSVFPAEGLGTEMCREGLEPTRLERDRPPSPPTRIPTYTDPTAQAPGAGPGSAGPPGHQAEPSPGWSRRGEGRHLARTPQGGPARGTVQTRRTYPTLRLQSLTGLGLKFSRHPRSLEICVSGTGHHRSEPTLSHKDLRGPCCVLPALGNTGSFHESKAKPVNLGNSVPRGTNRQSRSGLRQGRG